MSIFSFGEAFFRSLNGKLYSAGRKEMNIFLKYIKDGKKLDMLLSNIGGPQQSMSCAIKKKSQLLVSL